MYCSLCELSVGLILEMKVVPPETVLVMLYHLNGVGVDLN